MNKLRVILTSTFIVCLSLAATAQVSPGVEYFAGKWKVLVKGTPDGDSKMFVVLDRKDTTLAGIIQDTTGTEITKITKLELGEKQLTIYFTAQGYDVYLVMDKKDEDHFTGTLMGMFESEGERVKAPK